MHSAWSHLLASQNLAPSLADPTLPGFSSIEEATTRLQAAVLCPLPHLGALHVEGEEAAAFLHNLTSNDVKKMPGGGIHWSSLNSAKGRMLANFLVWRKDNGFTLILAAELVAEIAKKLSMYVLRAKVKVSDASSTVLLSGLFGAQASEVLSQAGLIAPANGTGNATSDGMGVISIPQAGATNRYLLVNATEQVSGLWQKLLNTPATHAVGTAAWIREDVLAGIPWVTKAIQEEFIAQMLNYELLGGVNFQKGCYPGQEIVARTQYLGKLKKRMYLAHLDDAAAPTPGQDLYAPVFGEQSCGKVVTVCPAPQGGSDLLIVVQMSAQEAGEIHLGSAAGLRLTLGALPYSID
ncbi:YgfZ/GcvT domain-containing protein [Uliginosibacterium gangwonense]|uniref:CAF17-like 4Fe-4S cluster assembly/insertion protein YgfZ n=1 Tax=Uliginosibacterium gangwonense TaxID=392736 RepID=UPI000367AD16|nr:folate-binding protein YgfZ [Uliginosibacterium gangwonense]